MTSVVLFLSNYGVGPYSMYFALQYLLDRGSDTITGGQGKREGVSRSLYEYLDDPQGKARESRLMPEFAHSPEPRLTTSNMIPSPSPSRRNNSTAEKSS
jgi:hypothetical protein